MFFYIYIYICHPFVCGFYILNKCRYVLPCNLHVVQRLWVSPMNCIIKYPTIVCSPWSFVCLQKKMSPKDGFWTNALDVLVHIWGRISGQHRCWLWAKKDGVGREGERSMWSQHTTKLNQATCEEYVGFNRSTGPMFVALIRESSIVFLQQVIIRVWW